MINITKISYTTADQADYKTPDYKTKCFSEYHERFFIDDKGKAVEKIRKNIYYGTNELKNRFDDCFYPPSFSLFEEKKESERWNPKIKDDVEESQNGIFSHLSINELHKAVNQYSRRSAFPYSKKLSAYLNLNQNQEDESNLLDEAKEEVKKFGLVFSKMLLNGGIGLKNALPKGNEYFFVDIDVKEDENAQLYSSNGRPNLLNRQIFAELTSFSVLSFRTSRGLGMGAILYCPDLKDISKNSEHKTLCKALTDFISKHFKVPIQFDVNQCNRSLGRRVPPQVKSNSKSFISGRDIVLNQNPVQFNIDFERITYKKEVKGTQSFTVDGMRVANSKTDSNLPLYRFDSTKEVKNFNGENDCIKLLLGSGVYELLESFGNDRELSLQKTGKNNKSITVYAKDGYVHNTFKCWTSSLDGYTPFHIFIQLYFNGDSKSAYQSLFDMQKKESIETSKETSSKTLILSNEEYDDYYYNLDNVDNRDKFFYDPLESIRPSLDIEGLQRLHDKTVDQLFIGDDDIPYFQKINALDFLGHTKRDQSIAYHNFAKNKGFQYEIDSLIRKDKTLLKNIEIEFFLSPEIFEEYCTSYLNIVISPCGTGKTTGILGKGATTNFDEKIGLLKKYKGLFVVPRTCMIEQLSDSVSKNSSYFASFGTKEAITDSSVQFISSVSKNPEKLLNEKGVIKSGIVTYNQFVGLNNDILKMYDYIILDESHSLTNDISFNPSIVSVYKKLLSLKKYKETLKFILMSATPETEIYTLYKEFKGDFNIIQVEKKQELYPEIEVIHKPKVKFETDIVSKKILECVQNGEKVIVFLNDKDKMYEEWEKLSSYCLINNLDVPSKSVLSKENQESDDFQAILFDERLVSDVTFTTSILNVGINISKGVENGVRFIFDFSSRVKFAKPSDMIQLIYRNRKLNTKVSCFANLKDKNGKFTFNISNKEDVFQIDKRIQEKFSYELKMQSIKLDENLNVQKNNLESSLSIKNRLLDIETQKYKKSLSSFISCAIASNMKVNYLLKNSDNDVLQIENLKRDFSINLITLLLKVYKENELIVESEKRLASHKVTTDITLDTIKHNRYNSSVYVKYHTTFTSTFRSIIKSFNRLATYYKEQKELKSVFNFIVNEKSKVKNIDKRLTGYLQRLKSTLSNNVIPIILHQYISKIESGKYDMKRFGILLERVIVPKIESRFFETLIFNTSNNPEFSSLTFSNKEFESILTDRVLNLLEKNLELLYQVRVSRKDKKTSITYKPVLRCDQHSEYNKQTFQLADLVKILSSKKTFENIAAIDNTCDIIEIDSNQAFLSDFLVTTYEPTYDHFSDNFPYRGSMSEDDFKNRFKSEIEQLLAINPKRRSEQAYALVNKISCELVAIDHSREVLHSILVEKGIASKMVADEGVIDYTNKNNFMSKEYCKRCINYDVINIKGLR